MRATWKEVELSATAFERLLSETSSATKVWRAGPSNGGHAPEEECEV
jgi:hypothetical protein